MEAASDQIQRKQCNSYSNHLHVSQITSWKKHSKPLWPWFLAAFHPCLLLSTHQATRNPEKIPPRNPPLVHFAMHHHCSKTSMQQHKAESPDLFDQIRSEKMLWRHLEFYLIWSRVMHTYYCSIVVYVKGNQWNVNCKHICFHTSMWNTEICQ